MRPGLLAHFMHEINARDYAHSRPAPNPVEGRFDSDSAEVVGSLLGRVGY
jgi:hypothetical protein